MIAAELAQRRFVQLKKNLAQCLGFRMTGGKALSVNLTQRGDEGVPVLLADFAVVVAVAIVETGFAHRTLHWIASDSILPSKSNGNLAPQRVGGSARHRDMGQLSGRCRARRPRKVGVSYQC